MDLFKPRKKKPRNSAEELKQKIVQDYAVMQRETTLRHRKYFKVLATKECARNEIIINASWQHRNKYLQEDMNTLKKKIWVAAGRQHRLVYENYMRQIYCHIRCQDGLYKHIGNLKTCIENIEKEIRRVAKDIYELNRKTVPDTQHQVHVAKARIQMQMKANRLEIGMSRECDFTAKNALLREKLFIILKDRASFNEFYMKMVNKLNYEKKYLTDLIEYALSQYEGCIEVYEKMNALQKRQQREKKGNSVDTQFMIRMDELRVDAAEFFEVKAKTRSLAQLESKESIRRQEFHKKHRKKLDLYKDVVKKILNYTKSQNVKSVIEKFQAQESRYYSYFNYTNEVGYHMTLLNNSVNRLYTEIDYLKDRNRNSIQAQLKTITDLEHKLEERKASNKELKRQSDNNDNRIETLMNGIQLLLDQCRVEVEPQKQFLGRYDEVSLLNMQYYLKIIQQRVIEIVAATYIRERMDSSKTYADYIIKDIEKWCEWPTPLNDIVLAQQCPECSHNDAYDIDDNGEGVHILSLEALKKKIYERVQQPEMQYRLHSVSQCRLPKSRILTAQRAEISQIFG